MSKKKNYKGFIITIAILVVVCSALTIGIITTSATLSQYAMRIENMYQKSFSELVTNVNNIEVDLSKILVSSGLSTKEKLYEQVYTNCNYASANLSQLPINHESINKTTKFVNQMGGFSYYVNQKLKNDENLSQADIDSTQELYSLCVYIQQVLNDFVKNINYNFSLLDNTQSGRPSSFNTMFESMQSENIKYPTLIYDGPFSESSVNKQTKGLVGEEITKEQAQDKIKQIFKDYGITNLEYNGQTTGIFETYNFSFLAQSGKNYYAQITKKGGLLLSLTSNGVSKQQDKLSLTECKAKAENFAKNLGLNLESVWATTLSNVAYINLTPVVGNVIIYPDMVKVKVSVQTGEILGWEASSYAHNHTERTDLVASISLENAKAKVGTELNIVTERLTLIPMEYNTEQLAYEFKCTFNNATYYVYINALTGDEIQILKVIATTNGKLLQ